MDKKDYQEFIINLGVIVYNAAINNDFETKLSKYNLSVEIPTSLREDNIISMIEYSVSIKILGYFPDFV